MVSHQRTDTRGAASAPLKCTDIFEAVGIRCAVPRQHKATRRRRILKAEAEQVGLLLGAGWCCSLLHPLE